ncbi:hypothetical protein SAMN06297251_10155 [Fulvimarina manganoxydans]|uniref:Uncharacterized protein n=1 Tax=Fulvimarina manganoxydans TaxID=937218 RepID=A0A1W1Y8Z8_9HYPH|nr:hypothetical protein [Fulvimarina manganoxydans]SMC32609.1 hypothetical protein SAMN06297251_10155 [Fulvimarina manganoxydans]
MSDLGPILRTLGMSIDDAASLLGRPRETLRSISSGRRPWKHADADLTRLRAIYDALSRGRVEGLHAGAADASRALRLLRGSEGIGEQRASKRDRKPVREVPDDRTAEWAAEIAAGATVETMTAAQVAAAVEFIGIDLDLGSEGFEVRHWDRLRMIADATGFEPGGRRPMTRAAKVWDALSDRRAALAHGSPGAS